MATINKLATVAVALLASALVCGCFEIDERYIMLPYLPDGLADPNERSLLAEIVNSAAPDQDSGPDSFLKQLEEVKEKEELGEESRIKALLADILISFSTKSRLDCLMRLHAQIFMEIYMLATRTNRLKSPKAVLAYLEHYGRQKMHVCAPKFIQWIENKKRNYWPVVDRIEDILDKSYSFDNKDIRSDDWYETLKGFDPTKAKWKKHILVWNSYFMNFDRPGDSAQVTLRDLLSQCFKFHAIVLPELMGLNLLKSLGGADYFEDRQGLQRLNEISRVCNQVDLYEPEFIMNIRKQRLFDRGDDQSASS